MVKSPNFKNHAGWNKLVHDRIFQGLGLIRFAALLLERLKVIEIDTQKTITTKSVQLWERLDF